MKIGIFTDSYLPYISGVVLSIETLTSELLKLGHEVFIVAPSYPNCKSESYMANGQARCLPYVFRLPSIPSPTNRDFTLAIPFSLRLNLTVPKIGLEVIHVHSPFLLGRLGARFARKLGIPLIFTFHTMYEEYVHYVPVSEKISRKLTRKICSNFCNSCDLVVVPTSSIKAYLQEMRVGTPVKILPSGLNLEKFEKVDQYWLRRRYNIRPEEKILLTVGRLGQEKNLSFLLNCFARISIEQPECRLVLVGSGPEKQALQNFCQALGINEKVIFTGLLPHHDVLKCYAGADLFVFSSLTETQGLVICEAKASGLPVVAVKAYGVSEMVEDEKDGFLTECQPELFMEKINLLLQDDQLRNKMSYQAKINAKKYSSLNCALKMLEEYQLLLNK